MISKKNNQKKVKLGIVGCGYWGPNLLRNFTQVDNTQVEIACDLNNQQLLRLKKNFPNIKTENNFDNFLKYDIDAVVIATPFLTHYSLTKKALQAGKHVLVEKPFVRQKKEILELNLLAEKKKRVLMIDHTFEYAKPIEKIKHLIQTGELGKLYTIDMVRVNLGIFQKDTSVIWDLAYHDLSILLFTLEKKPISISVFGKDFIQKGIIDSAYLNLHFPDNILVNIHVSWLEPYKIRKSTFIGSKRMLVFDDIEPNEKIKIHDKGVSINNLKQTHMKHFKDFYEFTYLYRSGDILIPQLEQKEPLKSMAEHFIECIRINAEPRSNSNTALIINSILDAAESSLKNNGKLIKIKYE